MHRTRSERLGKSSNQIKLSDFEQFLWFIRPARHLDLPLKRVALNFGVQRLSESLGKISSRRLIVLPRTLSREIFADLVRSRLMAWFQRWQKNLNKKNENKNHSFVSFNEELPLDDTEEKSLHYEVHKKLLANFTMQKNNFNRKSFKKRLEISFESGYGLPVYSPRKINGLLESICEDHRDFVR